MTITDDINRAATNPTARRADALMQAQPWMPADAATALANGDHGDNYTQAIGASFRQVLSTAWNGVVDAYDDPILHQQPSTALTLARFVTSSIGAIPVADSSLRDMQSKLQGLGYGKGLSTSGIWDSGWQQEYARYASDWRGAQIAGSGANIPTHKAAHSFLSTFTPTHIASALVGAAKAIPASVRTLASDTAGLATQTGSDLFGAYRNLVHGDVGGALGGALGVTKDVAGGPVGYAIQGPHSSTAANVGAHIEGVANHQQVTPEQYAQEHDFHRAIADIGTILGLATLAGPGTAAAKAATGEWGSGVDLAAAQRGPGVVAKSLFGGMSSPRLASTGADALTAVERQAVRGRALLNPQYARNFPLFNRIGPVIGKLADADGSYYRLRTTLAKPYVFGQVRAAGNLYQAALVGGTAARGLAALEGDHSALHQSISETDLSLRRIEQTPGVGDFLHGIDTLGLVLHGPLNGGNTVSAQIGSSVNNFVEGASDALVRVGAPGAFELATGKSIGDLQAAAGSPERLTKWMTAKLAEYAADHFVQDGLNKAGVDYGSEDYVAKSGGLADQIWNSPAEHVGAMRDLVAHPYELSNLIRAEIVKSGNDGDTFLRTSLHDYLDAGDRLRTVMATGQAKYLVGPQGRAVIRSAKDAFDYGGDQTSDEPLRLIGMTRRDYAATHDRLVNSLTAQLTQARQSLNDDLDAATTARSDAEALPADERTAAVRAATTRTRTAQGRLDAFDEAVTSGQTSKIARLADRSASAGVGSYLKSQFQTLNKTYDDLRNLVSRGLPADEQYSADTALARGYNPDELYSRITGPARPVPSDIGTGDWMQAHLAHDAGSLGLGHVEGKSAQEAGRDITAFERALTAAGDDQEKQAAVIENMKNYAFNHFNLDERAQGVFDGNPTKLIANLRDRAATLASEVFPTIDAPKALKDELAALREQGWRIMLGSHIGHAWDGSTPSMSDLGAAVSRRRTWAHRLGLNPDRIEPRTAGTAARLGIGSEIQRAMADPKFLAPPRVTAQTVMSVLRELVDSRLPLASHVAVAVTRKVHAAGIDALAAERGVDRVEAQKQYEAEIARALQLRDIPRKEAIRVLTTPAEGETKGGMRYTWPGLDQQSANLIYRALVRGYTGRTYLMGAQAIEDWGRAGFGFLDKIATRNPHQDWLQSLANTPNRIVQLRNRMRFTLSPFFDLRRVTKTNLKMGLEGVQPTWNPLGRLVEDGTFTTAHRTLQRVFGEQDYADADIADRYLYDQSVFGLYNARHYEAYFAHALAREGKSDNEIKVALNKVFTYGDSRTGARNAIERTANTIWFPFSFEKTLLRNTGAYLLDHPAQSMMLSLALDEYDKANKLGAVTDWVKGHLPVLHELNKLNAFAEGVGPGEFGGINAPLLNLFLPQQWGAKDFNKANLERLLPVWRDFGQVWQDATAQAHIAANATFNSTDWTLSHVGATGLADSLDHALHMGDVRGHGYFDPYRPTITPEAQREKAIGMRNQLIQRLQPVLAWNRSHPGAEYTFPMDAKLPGIVQGKAVNRENIGWLVHNWFPAYDPTSSAVFAERQAADTAQFLAQLLAKGQGGSKAAMQQWRTYSAFTDLADKWASWLNSDNYTKPDALAAMTAFHQAAVNLSEKDGSFYKFYGAHFRWLFGPLEEITAP